MLVAREQYQFVFSDDRVTVKGMREGAVLEFTVPEWKDLFSETCSEVILKTWGPVGSRDLCGTLLNISLGSSLGIILRGSFSPTYIF